MAKKTLYFDSICGYVLSAATENGKLCDFGFEKRASGNITGNIYKGRVENVLPGMNAAFVNCGLERNCYLSTEGVIPEDDKFETDGAGFPVFSEPKEGDEIIVQVVKPPVGKKGAKVTANPSFIGKSLIYMPETRYIGVSRKIADAELRHNLIYTAGKLVEEGEGLVVRSAAPYAKREQMEKEYVYLKSVYKKIKNSAASAKVGDLLYTDSALHVRVLRDILSKDIESVVVGSEKLKEQIESMINVLYPVQSRIPVKLYDSCGDMFEELGISAQIEELTSPRVRLENGAEIVIERTEALTVVDVNTGKFTGDDSLEQTVYYTNLLAAREIARQVRLRNIGGIVVVDFIDMKSESHRRALAEELRNALAKDKAKCTVSEVTQFGLVEFTRRRTGSDPLAKLLKPCRYCRGEGLAKTAGYVLFGLRAKILKALSRGAEAVRADVNAAVLEKALSTAEFAGDLKERTKGRTIYLVPHKSFHEEQFFIRTENFETPVNAVRIN